MKKKQSAHQRHSKYGKVFMAGKGTQLPFSVKSVGFDKAQKKSVTRGNAAIDKAIKLQNYARKLHLSGDAKGASKAWEQSHALWRKGDMLKIKFTRGG